MTYGLSKCKNKPCGKPFTRKAWNHEYCSISCQRIVGIQAYQDGVKKRNSRGMKFGKVSGSPAQRRILKLLKDKLPHTTRQIQEKANVCNPATWISALNMQGYDIECKYRGTDEHGSKIYTYQLYTKGKEMRVER